MPTLQEMEEPIERRIASALIEITPDSWQKARLEVETSEQGGELRMPHTISNPEGHREVVGATDEIIEATFELRELFRKHGRAWRRMVFEIAEQEGHWGYVVNFEYRH